MGASFSIVSGGHFSHREHTARASPSARTTPGRRPLREAIDFDAPAYRCSEPGCPFLLHDDCYRRPETIKGHLGQPRHRLTLGPAAAARSRPASCSLCARPLAAPAFVYGCADCGFRAHPRCCGLSPDISVQYKHGRLVLHSPSGGDTIDDDGSARRQHRRCLECGKTTGRRTAACSYQCPAPACDTELCLRCVLHNNGRRRAPRAVFYFGQVVGLFIKGILKGMGLPST